MNLGEEFSQRVTYKVGKGYLYSYSDLEVLINVCKQSINSGRESDDTMHKLLQVKETAQAEVLRRLRTLL